MTKIFKSEFRKLTNNNENDNKLRVRVSSASIINFDSTTRSAEIADMNANNMFSIDFNEIIDTGRKFIHGNLTVGKVSQITYRTSNDDNLNDGIERHQHNADVPTETQVHSSDATLQWLPTEMIEAIFIYLSPMDTIACAAVCRDWHELSDNATIWRHFCRRNHWKSLHHFHEPCLLNSDLDRSHFSLWKECFLMYSRIRNNWMEGNSWQRTEHLDSNYTNVVANSNIIITWFFIQNIKIFKIVNHSIVEWQSFQPVLKRRPIESIIINEQRNAFVVIQYGLLQYYEEMIVGKNHTNLNNIKCDNSLESSNAEVKSKFVFKFCKSFDVDESNMELNNRKINKEFQEWYERNVIRCNVNLNVKFNHGNLLYVCELERKTLYAWNINTAERKTVINLGQTVHKFYSKSNPTVLNFKLNKSKIFVSVQISNTIYLILIFCQRTFNLIDQIRVSNLVLDFHINEKYLVLDMMDNIRYLQIWETISFTILNKKCKIVGDDEKLGSILLVDDEVMFHRDNSVIIYDIKRKQCSTYPTYKIGSITNIILAPFNLFILEYHMSDRKFVYCLYDRVTYRWIVKKFIMSFKRKPQILFSNLNSIIIKEFNLVHYFTFW